MEANAFDLLHEGLQRTLWQMKWPSLRPLQVRSIKHVLTTDAGHLILSASTAAGKTEAAFLPVLSQIADRAFGSVRAIYVGPLKALINDQFGRLEELCENLEVPVYRWHGDVGSAAKAKLIQNPAGVLLITPESLESLFVNKSHALPKVFGGLQFVVIDELHSFLVNERGLHLRSLLSRVHALPRSGQSEIRLLGLSATLGEPQVAIDYLARAVPGTVELITDKTPERELRFRLHGYRESVPARSRRKALTPLADAGETPSVNESRETATQPPGQDGSSEDEDEASPALHELADDLVRHTAGTANLVFANAKSVVEELADVCTRVAERDGVPARYLVHHGSLAAEIREDAEATMKSGTPATTFCSSTLEMGIDIGSVHMVGQVDAPGSVASLAQRVGRSGRKADQPRILRMYVRCIEPGPGSNIFDRAHLNLVQAIAVSELMLDKQLEPPVPPACDLSTLTQQIISVIAQNGAVRADELYEVLCAAGAFDDIESELFGQLLRCLAQHDVIEQAPEGEFILGLAGERIRKDKGFYAVFPTPDDYSVLHDGRNIGKLTIVPDQGQYLLFAGRRWRVRSIDHERLELHVQPARGYIRPLFPGSGGEISALVRRKMRQVLEASEQYTYLNREALRLLSEARGSAAETGLTRDQLIRVGPQSTAVMTWTGSRIHSTILAILARSGATVENEGVGLIAPVALDRTREMLIRAASFSDRGEELAKHWGPRVARKYDELLTDELLDTAILRGRMDLAGARVLLRDLANP